MSTSTSLARRLLRVLIGLLAALAVLAVGAVIAAQFDAFRGTPPGDLGVLDGRLMPPSLTPNSVSSQARLWLDHPMRDRAAIDPLQPPGGDGRAAMQRLAQALEAMPRTTITVREPTYLRAECRTRLMGFTDDVELWLDERSGLIHVRSASRIGHGDRGVNRARVEALRQALKG